MIMVLFSADFTFILFLFPGIIFSVAFIFIWLFFSNYFLQKIDLNQEFTLLGSVKSFVITFEKQSVDLKFSKGFIFLLIEISAYFFIQLTILNDFFNTGSSNSSVILLLLLICISFEILYQLDLSSSIFIFIGKIFSTIVILICFGFMMVISKDSSLLTYSNQIVNNFDFISVFLFLIILFSISKLNTYMDYKKVPVFETLPNDQSLYESKIKNGNVSEKYVRWITESYSQIVLTQIIVLIMFPFLQNLINLRGPIWIQYFLLFVFQVVFLLLALFFNLLNPIIEYKLPNVQSKGIMVLLFVLGLLIFQ